MKLKYVLLGIVVLASAPALWASTSYWVVVDHHQRPLPGAPPAGWFYDEVGGDRGLMYDSGSGQFTISKPTDSSYQIRVNNLAGGGLWTFCGGWYALGRCKANHPNLNPSALLHPMILSQYQCQLTGIELKVNRIESPGGRSDLFLNLQLKGFDSKGQETLRWQNAWAGRNALLGQKYPASFFAPINPTNVSNIGLVLWSLDRARAGDTIDVDAIRLRVEAPTLPAELEALLWSLSHLLYNYDEISGMVQDRSNFPDGVFENVTATAKLAKLLALAVQLDVVDGVRAKQAVARIADTLLARVPRGPGGVNALWPHFTRNGGTQRLPGIEWASGDTAYAILDLMVALKMIGDPNEQLAKAEAFLHSINWAALQAPNGGFSHGYSESGQLLPGIWFGFGAETFGVLLAAQACGVKGEMGPPPTDNGSGFIPHAAYPVPLSGRDRWTNDWSQLRYAEVQAQLGWYLDPGHTNSFLAQRGWFGLSAGECPAGYNPDTNQIYQAYGIGGRYSPANDGSNDVAVLHYSGMVASLDRYHAKKMWESMRSSAFELLSPMNNLESISVAKANGATTINALKGSWNLALQTEGWMLAIPGASGILFNSFRSMTNLATSYDQIFPPQSPTTNWDASYSYPILIKELNQGNPAALNAVAFGGGGFIAVGPAGNMVRSRDGRAWLPVASGTTNDLNAVAFAEGQYVAVGNEGTIIRSADGTTWLTANSGTATPLNSLVSGAGKWLAVGDCGIAITSGDGAVWVPSRTGVSNNLLQAAYGLGQFIVAGRDLLRSTNGLDWTNITPTNLMGSSKDFKAIAFGGGTFVALAEVAMPVYAVGMAFVSSDAVVWATAGFGYRDVGSAQKLRSLGGGFAFFDPPIPVFGQDGPEACFQSMLASWDGLVWDEAVFSNACAYPLRDCAFGHGTVVAVGEAALRGVIRPALAHAAIANGALTAWLRGEPEALYEVQASSNLTDWTTLTNAVAANTRLTLTNNSGQAPNRFYRAVIQTGP